MNIALISDIHGNRPALQAALNVIDTIGVDQIVCLGDVAATGPNPSECLSLLEEREIPSILGNTDAWLLAPEFDDNASEFIQMIKQVDLWCSQQLTDANRAYLRTFRPTMEIALGAMHALLCFHGSPRSYHETIVATTPDDEVMPMMAGYDAAVLAGGHTHQPYCRQLRNRVLLNPGSIGLGYEQAWGTDERRNLDRAAFATVTMLNSYPQVTLHQVPFDREELRAEIRHSGMPRQSELLARW